MKNKIGFIFTVTTLLLIGCLLASYYLLINLQTNSIRALAWESENYLWTASYIGVVRWNTEQQTVVNRDFRLDGVEEIFVSKEGQVWAYGAFEVWSFESGKWEEIGASRGLMGRVYSITQVKNNTIWVATSTGFSYWDEAASLWKPSEIQGIGTVVAQDIDGYLWFGLADGVIRAKSEQLTHWTALDGLASNQVWSLLIASDNTVWVGTDKGVSHWGGIKWQSWADLGYPDPDGLVVDKLYETTDGAIWAATSEGVAKWDGQIWTTFSSIFWGDIYTFLEKDGELWIACQEGVFRWTGSDWYKYNESKGLNNGSVRYLIQGENGILYLGAEDNLYQYVDKLDRWQPFPTS